MKLHTEILRGLKWTAGAKLGSQLITWGITIYVMRLLSPADYGLLAMATVFLALLGMFAEVGLGPALVRSTELSQQTLRRAYGIVWTVNLALFALLNLGAGLIADFYSEPKLVPVMRALSLQFLLIPLGVIPDVMLQRQLEYKYRSLTELAGAVISSLVTLGLAIGGYGVWALVAGTLATHLTKVVILNLVAPFRALPSFSLGGMRQLVIFGGNVTASRFLWFFFTQADAVIVGRLLGEHVLGLYSVAMHLASLPVQRVSGILNQVAFPAASRFQHDRAAISTQLLKAIGYVSLIAFPVLWGMSCVAFELIPVLLGPDWSEAILPFQILTLVMPFRMIIGFLPTITDAIGRSEVALHNALLGCVVMPVSFYIGSHWGIAGVAYAWLSAYPVVLFINLRRMLGVIGIPLMDVVRRVAPALTAAAGMYLAVWMVRTGLGGRYAHTTALVLEIASGVCGYALLSLVCNRSLVLELLRQVRARRPPVGP
jgi:O-antigen/teichoic acid export membrane protein